MKAIQDLTPEVKIRTACQAFGFPRSSFYRWTKPSPAIPKDRPAPPLALSPEERQGVLAVLNSTRFMDQSPREIYATLS